VCAEKKSSCSKARLASAEAGNPSTFCFPFPGKSFLRCIWQSFNHRGLAQGVIAEFSDWLPVTLKPSTMKLLQTRSCSSSAAEVSILSLPPVPKSAKKCQKRQSVKVPKCQSLFCQDSPDFPSLQKGSNFKYLLFDKASSRPAAGQQHTSGG